MTNPRTSQTPPNNRGTSKPKNPLVQPAIQAKTKAWLEGARFRDDGSPEAWRYVQEFSDGTSEEYAYINKSIAARLYLNPPLDSPAVQKLVLEAKLEVLRGVDQYYYGLHGKKRISRYLPNEKLKADDSFALPVTEAIEIYERKLAELEKQL